MWQFISQGSCAAEHLFYIQLALDAGCRWIQLRMKEGSEVEITRAAMATGRLCAAFDARFILNDYLHLVVKCHADGVHLGLTDGSLSEARRYLGQGYIIGGTANTGSDLVSRVAEGADYIGLGPYRFTSTKKNLSPVLGLQGYRQILTGARLEEQRRPVFAIGGIVLADVPLLLNAGVAGVAISGWLCRQVDLAGWQMKTREILTLENVQNIYQYWKSDNAVAASLIIERVKELNSLLNTSPDSDKQAITLSPPKF